jgi:hypothetical protein
LDGIPPLYNLEFSLRLDKRPEKSFLEPGGISIAYDWNVDFYAVLSPGVGVVVFSNTIEPGAVFAPV